MMTSAEAFALHQPWQDEWELDQLTRMLLADVGVDVVVEIGTHRGGTARYWQDALDTKLVVTVDKVPCDDIGDAVGVFGFPSQHPETVRLVHQAVNMPVDMLFIDGGHTYWEVWEDYERYGGMVRPGGAVVFHDIGAGVSSSAKGCHVPMVWDEIVRKGGKTVAWRKSQGTGAHII